MSGPPKAWLMLSIECGFGARGASLSVRGAGAAAAALAAPSTTSSSGVGRLRKRGRPVSSFCIQLTNAVHDQTWKSQSFGFGGPGMLPPDRGEVGRLPPAREDVAGSRRTGRLSGGRLRRRRACLGGELGIEAEAEERGGGDTKLGAAHDLALAKGDGEKPPTRQGRQCNTTVTAT